MGKQRNYNFDFKLKLVLEVVEGHGSLRTVSRDAGINRRTLTHWVNLYNTHGEEALRWKKRLGRSMEEKIDLVLAYRGSNLSLSQAAAQFGANYILSLFSPIACTNTSRQIPSCRAKHKTP